MRDGAPRTRANLRLPQAAWLAHRHSTSYERPCAPGGQQVIVTRARQSCNAQHERNGTRDVCGIAPSNYIEPSGVCYMQLWQLYAVPPADVNILSVFRRHLRQSQRSNGLLGAYLLLEFLEVTFHPLCARRQAEETPAPLLAALARTLHVYTAGGLALRALPLLALHLFFLTIGLCQPCCCLALEKLPP